MAAAISAADGAAASTVVVPSRRHVSAQAEPTARAGRTRQ
jgi:hypothetical protein